MKKKYFIITIIAVFLLISAGVFFYKTDLTANTVKTVSIDKNELKTCCEFKNSNGEMKNCSVTGNRSCDYCAVFCS